MSETQMLLEVRDLHTHFRTDDGIVKAVDGVSFSLRRGETLGLVGESGSGKSVTCMSVMRLIPQPPAYFPAGQVHFGGRDLLRLTEAEMHDVRGNRIAMIFQDPMTSLNPFLKIGRQLTEVLEAHQQLSRQAARQKSIRMLQHVGIPDAQHRFEQYPHQFSGGMRQRVMIAMALLCQPEVLIADEPTTALDVTIQAQILDLIAALKREYGTSVLLITHDLGVVAGTADRVAVMYAGRIVEEGPTDEVFHAPQHPYTQGLIRSVPRLDSATNQSLYAIGGLPPDLSQLPSGCPFHPRCDRATELCRQQYPDTFEVSPVHHAKCWELLPKLSR